MGVAISDEALTLSEDGIKELSLNIGFNLGKIRKALPAYRVTQSSDGHEILINSGDELIITLHREEKGLFIIEIHSNKVTNLLGHSIGDSFHHIYGKSNPHCEKQEETSRLFCVAPGSRKVLYIFDSSNAKEGKQKIVSIFWSYEWMSLKND